MAKIIDVTGGRGGTAFLVLGEKKTALIDCGMAYCAPRLIGNARQALAGRDLDHILISHSHYDHIGAIPYLRAAWPALTVLGAAHARHILGRANALKTIRALGNQAAMLYAGRELAAYDDALLTVDRVIADGDILDLGGDSVKVIETKGHTQCSLSFLIDGETLFASESSGCLHASDRIFPAFISSYADAVRSINACQAINPRAIVSPHYGLVTAKDTPGYWRRCLLAAQEAREFVLHLAERGLSEEQLLARYEQAFRDDHNRREQPLEAFRLNARGMIKTVLKEKAPTLPLAR